MSLTDFLKSIADAIRNKTNTTGEIPASEFAERIEAIETGIDTSDATATADKIQNGYTAYTANGKITGTLAPAARNIKTGVTIAGVQGTFTSDADATAAHILTGKIGYVKGSKVIGTMPNNEPVNMSFTPSTTSQSKKIPQGYHDGTGTITVAAAPVSLINGDATAAHVLKGKTFFSDSYTVKTGTMTNNEAVSKSITPSASVQTYTIPEGYHNGLGKVTVATDANLKAANIKSGVKIFGVTGSMAGAPSNANISITNNTSSTIFVTTSTAFTRIKRTVTSTVTAKVGEIIYIFSAVEDFSGTCSGCTRGTGYVSEITGNSFTQENFTITGTSATINFK